MELSAFTIDEIAQLSEVRALVEFAQSVRREYNAVTATMHWPIAEEYAAWVDDEARKARRERHEGTTKYTKDTKGTKGKEPGNTGKTPKARKARDLGIHGRMRRARKGHET